MLGSAEFGDAIVLADFEAGIGTLTRLTETQIDVVLVVVEPTPKSLEVGQRAAGLARERQMGRLIIVACRVRNDEDAELIRQTFPDNEIVLVPDDHAIVDADHKGLSPLDSAPDSPAVLALTALAERLVPVPA